MRSEGEANEKDDVKLVGRNRQNYKAKEQIGRPVYKANGAYSYGNRGLFSWQKRPIHMAKEQTGRPS